MKSQVALIGVSGFGKHHLMQLQKLVETGKINLAAAVVINPEEVAEQLEILKNFQTRIYPDAAAFFHSEAGKIDLVCIPTGIGSHETLTTGALAAGMNVLVEKPASGSAVSVERMIAAEKNSGKFAAVAFQHAYAPEIHYLKRLLLSGRLGKITALSTLVCWPRKDEYYQRNLWAAKRAVNGVQILDSPLNNACAHYLNMLLFLSGRTAAASAAAVSVTGSVWRARPEIEMFDACDVDFVLDNGATAHVMLAHCCETQINPHVKIICENAVIKWDTFNWSVTDNDGAMIASGTVVNPGEAMFKLVTDKIFAPDVPVYTLANALEHTRCVELLDRSCPIENIAASYVDGLYRVAGLEQRFMEKFEK